MKIPYWVTTRAMAENNSETHVRKLPVALFLETSAQILRIAGSPEIRRGINELINATPKPTIGTSAGVKREFDYSNNGIFHSVKDVLGSLPKPAHPLPFEDLWQEIEGLLPPIYPGGPKYLSSLRANLIKKITERFRNELLSPNQLKNVLDGLHGEMASGFIGEVFDESSCGVWESRGHCPCDPQPGDHCKLKEICITNRDAFLASVTTLAHAGREESRWLLKNLEHLHELDGKALLEFLGKHRSNIGDLIIFWEAPKGWTVLSRDRTFRILRDAHRTEIEFFMVRLPRILSGQPCQVGAEGMTADVDGILLNYNAKGARVKASDIKVKEGQKMTLTAREYGRKRVGQVSQQDDDKASDDESKSIFGLKLRVIEPR